ncbi:MAG: PEP-utilizing enzyme [bacterium]
MPESPPVVWSRSLADEFWSGSVTPLMFSVSGRLIETRMVDPKLAFARIEKTAPFLRYHHGYVYANTNLLGDIFSIIPSIFRTKEVLDNLPASLRDRLLADERSLWSILGPRFVGACFRTVLHERDWSPFTNHRRFKRHGDAILARAVRGFGDETASGTPESLLNAMARIEDEMGAFLEIAIWSVAYAYLLYPLVRIVCERWLGDTEGTVAEWAMGRVPGNKTVEVNEAIEALARRLRANPTLAASLRAGGLDALGPQASLDSSAAEFRDGFHELLLRHGHRLLGRDLIYPSWREAPGTVLDLVLKALEARREGEVAVAAAAKPPPAELAGRDRLAPFQRLVLALGLYYMPRYVNLRENMRYFADLFLERIRNVALALGEHLVARGRLEQRDQIFFLFREEVTAAVRGDVADLAGLARRRRIEYERGRDEKPPRELLGDQSAEIAVTEPLPANATLFRGSGVSRGVVRGRARVVLEVGEFRDVRPGEILVTNATDPGWTCLFSLAGGVIMEMGGMLSHGAILAREYGLPAVASVPGATKAIPTGAWVEVDGLKGEVRILD